MLFALYLRCNWKYFAERKIGSSDWFPQVHSFKMSMSMLTKIKLVKVVIVKHWELKQVLDQYLIFGINTWSSIYLFFLIGSDIQYQHVRCSFQHMLHCFDCIRHVRGRGAWKERTEADSLGRAGRWSETVAAAMWRRFETDDPPASLDWTMLPTSPVSKTATEYVMSASLVHIQSKFCSKVGTRHF